MSIKKVIFYGITVIVVIAIAWWFVIRKQFIKDKLQQVVSNKTKKLYRLTYDSSFFNEAAGNATFYNIHFEVDSAVLQQKILAGTTPEIIASVKLASLSISGLKAIALLTNTSLNVDKIVLDHPVVKLTRLTNASSTKSTENDTLQLYKALLGNYKLIYAKSIGVTGGTFSLVDEKKMTSYAVEAVKFNIKNFVIDSLHNYNTIASYFIKDAVVSTGKISFLKDSGASKATSFIASSFYDAPHGVLNLQKITTGIQSVGSIAFDGLQTKAFIYNQVFNSRKLTISDVSLSLKREEKKGDKNNKEPGKIKVYLPYVLSAVKVDTFSLVNGSLTVQKPTRFIAKFKGISSVISTINIDDNGLSLEDYFARPSLSLRVDECTYMPLYGLHKTIFKNISYEQDSKMLHIASYTIKPVVTMKQYADMKKPRKTFFNLEASDIILKGIALKQLFLANKLKASSLSASAGFDVYLDKTLPEGSPSKAGNFPQQQILKAPVDIDVSRVDLRNCRIAYTENSGKLKTEGTILFTGVDATVKNIHNHDALQEPITVNVTAKFMDTAKFKTNWMLYYDQLPGAFKIEGTLEKLDLKKLNPVTEPLAIVKINSGLSERMEFTMTGFEKNVDGLMKLTYDSLNISILKNTAADSLAVKKGLSALTNFVVKNSNKSMKNIRFNYKPNKVETFFSLIWNSLYEGIKKTVF